MGPTTPFKAPLPPSAEHPCYSQASSVPGLLKGSCLAGCMAAQLQKGGGTKMLFLSVPPGQVGRAFLGVGGFKCFPVVQEPP